MRRHVIAALLLAVLVGAFWLHRVHLDQPARYGEGAGDLVTYFYPIARHLHRELESGRLPVWNPYQLAGVPLRAVPLSQTLYPPQVISLRLLEPAPAIEAQLVFHLFIAGLGSWLFTRRLGLSAPACAAAALGYLLAGQTLRWQYNPAHLATLAWLPAILWAVHGALSARRRWVLVLAVVLALALLGGWAQGFLFELQTAALYGLVGLVLWARPTRRPRVLGLACAAALLFLGLVAAQLLASLEVAVSGTRGLSGVPPLQANLGALAPEDLLHGLLGLPDRGDPQRMNHWIPWRQGSAALLTLPLLALGLADRPRRAQWLFFVACALFCALFMLGLKTPVFRLYLALPLGDAFRIPSRLGFLYAFALAVLLAIGVEGARTLLRRRWPRAAAGVAVGLALGVGVDLYARSSLPFTRPVLMGDTLDAPADLVASLGEQAAYDRIYVFRKRAKADPRSRWLQVKLGTANGLFVVPDYEPLLPGVYRKLIARSDARLWRGVPDWKAAAQQGGSAVGLERRLDLLSVRFYLYDPPVNAVPAARLQRLGKERPRVAGLHLRERESALPRAYLVHEVVHEPDPDRRLERLLHPDFEPRRTVLVANPLPGLVPPPGGAHEAARILSYGPTEVALSATCASRCLLVLTDLAYPGWTARVDGVEAPIHTANLLFRAVALAPGEHEVVFRYAPTRLRIAGWVSVGSVAFVIGLAVAAGVRGWRTRRR